MAQLEAAAGQFASVEQLLEQETAAGRRPEARGSVARALHRLTCGCKFVLLLLEGLVESLEADGPAHGNSDLRAVARSAYAGSMRYYHPAAVRMAVSAGLYLLPGREAFLEKLGIPAGSVQTVAAPQGRRFVAAARPLTEAIHALLLAQGVNL